MQGFYRKWLVLSFKFTTWTKKMMENVGHIEEADMRKESEGGCKAL